MIGIAHRVNTYAYFCNVKKLLIIALLLQLSLIKHLQLKLEDFDKKLNKRELDLRRKERLAYVGISLDNVLPPTKEEKKIKRDESESESDEESESESEESSTSASDSDEPIYQLRQRRQAHSYRFNDYDELINSAIQVSFICDL